MERGDCFGHPSAADLSLSAEVIPSSYRWTFPEVFPQLVAPRSLKIEEVSIADCRSGRQGHSLMITCWVASEGYSDI